MSAEPRETLGKLLENKEFQVHLVSFPFFLVILAVSCGKFWSEIYLYSHYATVGLIFANYLGTITLGACLFSWILIDQISWLARAIILLIVGFLFIVSAGYLLVVCSSANTFVRSDIVKVKEASICREVHCNGSLVTAAAAAADNISITLNKDLWVQVLLCLNLFQGVFCSIFFLCLCAVLDATDATST